MQVPRVAGGSLPETLGIDRGSTSGDAGLDQQICWNNMQSSAQNQLPDYIMPSSNTSVAYLNSTSRGGQNLSTWIGEPSSSTLQNQVSHNEQKVEHGWSSSMRACGGAESILEERQYHPAHILSLSNDDVNQGTNQIANEPFFLQSSTSSSIPQDLSINSAFVERGVDDCNVIELPNAYKSGGALDNMRVPCATNFSNQFDLPSGSGGYLEENDRVGCSFEGRRVSCKRKALEGHVGQSSGSGRPNHFQPAEGNGWHSASTQFNAGSSSGTSTPSGNTLVGSPLEHVNPSLGLGVRGAASGRPLTLNPAGSAEGSRRNFRLRINASHQQDSFTASHQQYSITSNVFPTGSAAGHSNVLSSHPSARPLPLNISSDLRSTPAGNTNPQGQSVAVRVPALRRNLQSARWNGSSTSRPGSSSNVVSVERDAPLESNSRSMPRNMLEHPIFVPAPDMRNSAQNPTNWSLSGGNISIAGNVASTSQTGSSSGGHSSSAPNWVSRRSSPHYPPRLSELVRRYLLSSAGSESGAQSSNYSPLRSGPSGPPASPQEMALSSGAANQRHHLSHSRSAIPLERQLDGAFGIPHSVRTLAAASEGRSRLVSEIEQIRSVLDLMRRGEGLRFEDVMILDQSVFFGMADVHDRHRDMRLDVDNMSYEELLALEERIGNVCTGLSEETILNCLKQRTYIAIATENQMEAEPCCICQEEYNDGDDLGMLECGHDFHSNCIKQWLMHKNLCPICKTAALSK
ncbi:unnamed protein product [Ilex paraguariensis]|uniref:RING-type E3 ubiquitin transferase n=1 Tax=Ilex paraguariensis TaxID=185542 RepID=A0ABC8UBQ6_9AQUA